MSELAAKEFECYDCGCNNIDSEWCYCDNPDCECYFAYLGGDDYDDWWCEQD